MNKMLTTGLIAGGIISAAGISWVMADKNAHKRIFKNSERMIKKAGFKI